MHAGLHYFSLEGKNNEKFLSQISRNEENGKKQNGLLQNTSRFLEMELWRLKVHVRRGILCTGHAHFYRLYLVTDVSYGDGKGVIFLHFAGSFIWWNNFVQEELFILTIFIL